MRRESPSLLYIGFFESHRMLHPSTKEGKTSRHGRMTESGRILVAEVGLLAQLDFGFNMSAETRT